VEEPIARAGLKKGPLEWSGEGLSGAYPGHIRDPQPRHRVSLPGYCAVGLKPSAAFASHISASESDGSPRWIIDAVRTYCPYLPPSCF
jgi:hypothetical protein